MSINRDKPDLWKNDILQSVDLYNRWFMEFAPKAFRETRVTTASSVEKALINTNFLENISIDLLKKHPEVLPILRMSTCPPIARDRLVGLAGVSKSLVENMENTEKPRISPRMAIERLSEELASIVLALPCSIGEPTQRLIALRAKEAIAQSAICDFLTSMPQFNAELELCTSMHRKALSSLRQLLAPH